MITGVRLRAVSHPRSPRCVFVTMVALFLGYHLTIDLRGRHHRRLQHGRRNRIDHPPHIQRCMRNTLTLLRGGSGGDQDSNTKEDCDRRRNVSSCSSSSFTANKKQEKEAKRILRQQLREARLQKEAVALKELQTKLSHLDISTNGTKPFGSYVMIQSQGRSARSFVQIQDLKLNDRTPGAPSSSVWIRARVHRKRQAGKVMFLMLRERGYTVQAVLTPEHHPAMLDFAKKMILPESIVDIEATLSPALVKACTKSDFELLIRKIYLVSKPDKELPFGIDDSTRSVGENGSRVMRDHRLNHRVVDIRAPVHYGVFEVISKITECWQEALHSRGFLQIHTPKLISGSSEGGAEVFRVNYFGTAACLAQSPQLYKQMAIMADLRRVYEIGPVFRAEMSNTQRHLCEFTGLDFEMEIKEHFYEAIDLIEEVLISVFHKVSSSCRSQISSIVHTYYNNNNNNNIINHGINTTSSSGDHIPLGLETSGEAAPHVNTIKAAKKEEDDERPFCFDEPITVLPPGKNPRIHFKEAVRLLRSEGISIGDFDDLTTEMELTLGRIIKERYKTDFYVVYGYPAAVRPFYTMLDPTDANYTNSYDLFLRGQEISSGAQRVHDSALLRHRLKVCNVSVESVKDYVNSFSYGAPPHAGAGIGLERLAMLFLQIPNIRECSMFPRDPKRLSP